MNGVTCAEHRGQRCAVTAKQADRRLGFTLIELLIVVMIIAVLAAIALPNFLAAQTRAKVSRARADMRTIATGLEAYGVDNNHYPPNDGVYNVTPIQLSTPNAYLSTSKLIDPFSEKETVQRFGVNPELAKEYTYTLVIPTLQDLNALMAAGAPAPAIEALGFGVFNPGAETRYGAWRLVSNGPERTYSDLAHASPDEPWNTPAAVLKGSDIPYDASNGVVSWGNLLRTRVNPEMALP